MPFVKFSNKTQIRTIKKSFIWLDYVVLIKGNQANFLLTIVGNLSKDTETYSLSHFDKVDRLNRPQYEFQEASKSAIINFPNTSKYFLEIVYLQAHSTPYEINLYYK